MKITFFGVLALLLLACGCGSGPNDIVTGPASAQAQPSTQQGFTDLGRYLASSTIDGDEVRVGLELARVGQRLVGTGFIRINDSTVLVNGLGVFRNDQGLFLPLASIDLGEGAQDFLLAGSLQSQAGFFLKGSQSGKLYRLNFEKLDTSAEDPLFQGVGTRLALHMIGRCLDTDGCNEMIEAEVEITRRSGRGWRGIYFSDRLGPQQGEPDPNSQGENGTVKLSVWPNSGDDGKTIRIIEFDSYEIGPTLVAFYNQEEAFPPSGEMYPLSFYTPAPGGFFYFDNGQNSFLETISSP